MVRPERNDCVKFHYTAWTRDGSLLASTDRSKDPADKCLAAIFPGVVEALENMVVGEQRRAWVPAGLASATENGEKGEAATFDLELVEIIKAPAIPEDLLSPPRDAVRLPSGLILDVLKPGSGTQHPTSHSRVKLDFSGWKRDGTLFQSTVMAHHPAVFHMVAVIPGWREALATMVTGEKVRLWTPASLAYGPRPRRGQPAGDLVYDLELLSFDL
ncbi:MAG TPA: FKBP-type peptidyl-prolyl cis-trans isomerase [Polyangia bacterium]|nr:FKBP-type peptidyl-prolyl cis-trans isomerase [Polyangia bacterium]